MEKWQGSFAQSQLEKFGWSSGDGLGKHRDGRTKHISVTKKSDKKGVGVGQSQWEFAWWDHLYNKSASEVTVEKDDQEQIKVTANKKKTKTGETSEMRRSVTGIISTERPTGKTISTTSSTTTTSMSSMASMADQINDTVDSMVKDLHVNVAQRIAASALYGGFVKSSTGAYDP
ncbi:uncharacterized protein BX664DRAFT_332111 [Halteromyces radiatus]|uniref:uncharacterized protein n=1 Tax=Halteromyces radiatus TaxID=101107 RepID=UPI0022205DDA|nr:uncharacterized protein BX664DRAFT_332111 [Halteromyces radiatus]KAI8089075.1 hypothetical protein BX664DRAFT_332111 [Halteromyces radiatus]